MEPSKKGLEFDKTKALEFDDWIGSKYHLKNPKCLAGKARQELPRGPGGMDRTQGKGMRTSSR